MPPNQLQEPTLPATLTETALFQKWSADSLKLYLWLRGRVTATPAPTAAGSIASRRGYLEVDAAGAEIERAIGVSKNTVTKVVRELRDLRAITFRADRVGYHFRLGEWVAWTTDDADLELRAAAFYLDALLEG